MGLRVLDFSRGLPGALATMLLADYGAEVTKIESPEGDPLAQGPAFRVWNRGKKSVILDLRRRDGVEKALALASNADVLLETFRPGVAEGIGIGYPQVSRVNPYLVYCSISSYGMRGPRKDYHGYEGLASAAAAIMTDQPGVRDGPMFCSIPLASIGASMLALQGILAALHVRSTTGRGQHVTTSMYEGAIAIRHPVLPIARELPQFIINNVEPQGGLPAYRMYPCGDGRWIHIGCLTRWFWEKLAIALDLLELATDPRFELAPPGWPREEDRRAAIGLIGNRLMERPSAHWLKVLEEGDVPAAAVLTTQEFMDLPQVHHNGMVIKLRDPLLGEMEQAGLAIGFSETPGLVRGPAPIPGQHTREVLSNLDGAGAGSEAPGPRKRPRNSHRHPLDGLTVLDLSAYIAGPLGPMMLSDLGADVVKVEPINGEGAHSIPMLILGANRGKRDVALDLKAPLSREVILRLIRRSDVVVHNMRVGVAERLGTDYESVRRIRPDVIYVHSTAYGSTGPEARKPGFDPLFQSLSGITARQGTGPQHPIFLRTPVCDDTNAMLLAVAVLMALHHRDRTGQGQKVELSLINTGVLVNADDFIRYRGKVDRVLADNKLYGFSALYRLYETTEGWLFLSCVQAKEWERLKATLGGKWSHCNIPFEAAAAKAPWNEKLCDGLSTEFAQRPAAEWEERLTAEGVPCVKAAEDKLEGFYQNPQALDLGVVDSKEHPRFTELQQPGVLVHFSDTPAADRPAAALIGQHTLEVLRELGFDEEELAEMRRAGVIATAEIAGA